MLHGNVELLLQPHIETEEKQQHGEASSLLTGERVIAYVPGAEHWAQVGGCRRGCSAWPPCAALLAVTVCAEESLGQDLANAALGEAAGMNEMC